MVRRIVPFLLTAIILYGLAPAVLEVFGAWDEVDDLEPWWWLAVLGTQAGSLVCFFWLQRLALQRASWFAVGTSNLAGGALGRVVPGGAATTAALQFRMLTQAGVRPGLVATGLTAGSLLLIAALGALPVLTVPFVIGGLRVPETLVEAAVLAGAVFVALFALGAVLFTGEGAIGRVGRVARWTMRKVRRDQSLYADLPERLTGRRDEIRTTLGERWPEAVAAALGRWVLDFLTLVAALTAVDARPNLALTLLAYVAAQLLAQVPLTPGGLGVVEAGMTATLALAGVPPAAAAAATLTYRLASYWLQLPAGLVAYVLHRRRFGGPPPAEAVP
ncbi:MAG TPA: YbhN family protein [Solirubrobacteraceae bacterium]|nr:YbhN family protein [Solirubrobacteraceae bacterium]